MTIKSGEVAAWVNHEDEVFISILSDFMVEHKNLYGFDVREDVLCVVRLS